MKIRFLADADLNADIVAGIRRRAPLIDIQSADETGLFIISQNTDLRVAIDELLLIWSASEAEEWINIVVTVPF